MEWLKVQIEFASHFSYRMPGASSQFAIPCLLPGPSTVKLALVSTAISHFRDVSKGERIFDIVKKAQIRFHTPEKIAVFTPLIKRLKAKKKTKGQKIVGFESTYGIRGYVIFPHPITLYLGISTKILKSNSLKEMKEVLKSLRRLGTSDSLLSVLNVTCSKPEDSINIVKPLEKFSNSSVGGILQIVDDISPDATFEQVNIYDTSISKKKKEAAFLKKYYVIPIKALKEGGNWTIYSRLEYV